jgi:hypothetical protein
MALRTSLRGPFLFPKEQTCTEFPTDATVFWESTSFVGTAHLVRRRPPGPFLSLKLKRGSCSGAKAPAGVIRRRGPPARERLDRDLDLNGNGQISTRWFLRNR